MKKYFALVLVMTHVTSAQAQSPADQTRAMLMKWVGTMNVRADPHFSDGKLDGCTYVFDAVTTDWTYRQGDYLKVSGSVMLSHMGEKVGASLKVVANLVNIQDDGRIVLVPSPPSRAFLMDENFKTNTASLVDSAISDTPGGLFSVFQPIPTMNIVSDATVSKKLTVAFNQLLGNTDLIVPVELDVENMTDDGIRIRNDKAISSFSKCVLSLFETSSKGGRVYSQTEQ